MSKFALLIGVGECGDGFDPLPKAFKDLEAMHEVLVNPEIGGFADTDVKMLSSPSSGQKIEYAIDDLFANRKKDDLVLLYFSGHSALDGDNRFYFSSSKTYKRGNRLNSNDPLIASTVHKFMRESEAQRQVVILDCGYGDHFTRGFYAGDKSCAILIASEYVLSSGEFKLSNYTHFLIEGLRTGAGNREGDSLLSVEELHTYAKTEGCEAQKLNYSKFRSFNEGGKIKLAKIPMDAPVLKYRKEVQCRVRGGLISIPARMSLNSLLEKLQLEIREAEKIEEEVLHPYKEYAKALKEMLQEDPLLSELTKRELKDFQKDLGIEDSDVRLIHERLLRQHTEAITDEPTFPSLVDMKVLDQLNPDSQPNTASQTTALNPNHPIEIFFSYAREDEVLRDKLANHLKLLEREQVIKAWHDRNITAGEEWKNSINTNLESAEIILLLISADFLASDYCYDIEMKRALERHENKETRVIPIILRSVDWHRSPFGKLVALPTDGKPVTSWPNLDEAFTDVAKGLRRVIYNLQSKVANLSPANEEPSMISERDEKPAGYSQTNRESSTGFQINVSGGTVNISPPNPQY
jgi:hypothetical protein